MSTVFLDTVGLIALWDESDQWHSDAEAAFSKLIASRRPFLTTSFVLFECGNAASRRPYRSELLVVRNSLITDGGLIEPNPQDCQVAWKEYELGYPGDPGIVDCISFAVMRRLGITEAFTNDQHFKAAGFETLF